MGEVIALKIRSQPNRTTGHYRSFMFWRTAIYVVRFLFFLTFLKHYDILPYNNRTFFKKGESKE